MRRRAMKRDQPAVLHVMDLDKFIAPFIDFLEKHLPFRRLLLHLRRPGVVFRCAEGEHAGSCDFASGMRAYVEWRAR